MVKLAEVPFEGWLYDHMQQGVGVALGTICGMRTVRTPRKGDILLNEDYPVFVIDRKLTVPCDCEECERWRERNRFQAGIMPAVDEELAASLL